MKIENTFLLVLDIQEKLMPVIQNNEKIIKYTNILINGCKELNIPVIYTEQYPKGLGETIPEIKASLNEANAKYFSKNIFSAYPVIKDEILKLKQEGRSSVIIAGVETHICIYQTIKDLKDEFKVYLPFESVGSRNPENYKNGLDLIKEMGASVTNVETILFDLIKSSEHPSFKVISKLIK